MSVEYPGQSIRIRSSKEITIRIRENYGYLQNIYPRIHIHASLITVNSYHVSSYPCELVPTVNSYPGGSNGYELTLMRGNELIAGTT